MYIEGAPVLHIVGEARHFFAALFFDPLTTPSIWETILMSWAIVYTELPFISLFDYVLQFRVTLVEIFEIHDVQWKRSDTQYLSASGIEESYNEPLRRKFLKPRMDHQKAKKEFLLSPFVKARNDTLGSEGFVLSALIFG